MPSQKGDTFRVTGSANTERCGYQGMDKAPVMSKDSAMNTDDGLGSPEPFGLAQGHGVWFLTGSWGRGWGRVLTPSTSGEGE